MNKATLNVNDAGLNLKEIDITEAMSIRIKRAAATNYSRLVTQPKEELKDVFVALQYNVIS